MFTHWLVTLGWSRKWKCQLCRWITDYSPEQMSGWRAVGGRLQQLQGLRKDLFKEVTECVDGRDQRGNWSLTHTSDSIELGTKVKTRKGTDLFIFLATVINYKSIKQILQSDVFQDYMMETSVSLYCSVILLSVLVNNPSKGKIFSLLWFLLEVINESST